MDKLALRLDIAQRRSTNMDNQEQNRPNGDNQRLYRLVVGLLILTVLVLCSNLYMVKILIDFRDNANDTKPEISVRYEDRELSGRLDKFFEKQEEEMKKLFEENKK
jgi:hypothetical protein